MTTIQQEQRGAQATPTHLRALATEGYFRAPALMRALHIIGTIPGRSAWQRWLERMLLVLGALFLLSGIFFFFAYNWSEMHRFAKLGLVQGVILLTVALVQWRGLARLSGRIALTVAMLLVGVLLAIFGQAYQTGADSYRLFLNWAVLTAGWVLIGRFAPLWLIWLGIVNLALYFFWEQVFPGERYLPANTLFALNAVALALWEWAAQRGVPWLQERWFPRIIAVVALISITVPTVDYILSWGNVYVVEQQWPFLSPLLYLLFLAGMLTIYRNGIRDLFMLTAALASVIVVVTVTVYQIIDIDSSLVVLGLAVLVVIQATLSVIWMRRVQERWEEG